MRFLFPGFVGQVQSPDGGRHQGAGPHSAFRCGFDGKPRKRTRIYVKDFYFLVQPRVDSSSATLNSNISRDDALGIFGKLLYKR